MGDSHPSSRMSAAASGRAAAEIARCAALHDPAKAATLRIHTNRFNIMQPFNLPTESLKPRNDYTCNNDVVPSISKAWQVPASHQR